MRPFPIILAATDATARPVDNPDPVTKRASGYSQVTVRVVAAVVMIPPVLACVYFGSPVFDIFVAVLVALMAWEWRRLVYNGERGRRRFYWLAFGVFYITLPALALLWLRADGTAGRNTIFWLFALVWAADSGAYVAGRLIGGPKLAPGISPNKTWAGLAGCVASAALVGVVVAYLAKSGDYVMLAALSAVIGLVSQGGDLVESALKRHFGVKDSGSLIPGHGGVLDRVDALLAAILFTALIKFAYGGSIVRWS